MHNSITLVGRVTRDIDLKYLPSGMAVASLSLVTERRVKGEKKPSFHNIKVWGKTAESVAQYSGKGRLLLISGYLDYEQWEKDGQKHSKAVVTAERVQFLDFPKQQGGGEQLAQDVQDVFGGMDDSELPF